jgi:hypothetical protein
VLGRCRECHEATFWQGREKRFVVGFEGTLPFCRSDQYGISVKLRFLELKHCSLDINAFRGKLSSAA